MSYKFPDGVILFTANPENRGLYFEVYFWPDITGMRQYLNSQWPKETGNWNNDGAATVVYQKRKNGRLLPFVGEIHFCREYATTDFIAHEAGHAALAWWVRVRPDYYQALCALVVSAEDEERYCRGLGELAGQIAATLEAYSGD